MQRRLAFVGLLCGLAALAVALAPWEGGGDVTGPGQQGAASARGGPWQTVAQRLEHDLALDARQAAAVERALARCHASLQAATAHEDALWRDRLRRRARRRAFADVVATLDKEQQKDFKYWLDVDAHRDMRLWFQCTDKDDCGCG